MDMLDLTLSVRRKTQPGTTCTSVHMTLPLQILKHGQLWVNGLVVRKAAARK